MKPKTLIIPLLSGGEAEDKKVILRTLKLLSQPESAVFFSRKVSILKLFGGSLPPVGAFTSFLRGVCPGVETLIVVSSLIPGRKSLVVFKVKEGEAPGSMEGGSKMDRIAGWSIVLGASCGARIVVLEPPLEYPDSPALIRASEEVLKKIIEGDCREEKPRFLGDCGSSFHISSL